MIAVQKHLEGSLELIRQTSNRFVDVFFVYAGIYQILAHLTIVDIKLIGSLIGDGVLKFLSFIIIDKDISHDCKQPAFEVGAFLEMIFISKCFQHGVLQQILSILYISGKVVCKALEILGVACQHLIKLNGTHFGVCLINYGKD